MTTLWPGDDDFAEWAEEFGPYNDGIDPESYQTSTDVLPKRHHPDCVGSKPDYDKASGNCNCKKLYDADYPA